MLRVFDDKVLAGDVNIFENCVINWIPISNAVLKRIFLVMLKLEAYTIFNILTQTIFKVTGVVEIPENLRIIVNWFDKTFNEIKRK